MFIDKSKCICFVNKWVNEDDPFDMKPILLEDIPEGEFIDLPKEYYDHFDIIYSEFMYSDYMLKFYQGCLKDIFVTYIQDIQRKAISEGYSDLSSVRVFRIKNSKIIVFYSIYNKGMKIKS